MKMKRKVNTQYAKIQKCSCIYQTKFKNHLFDHYASVLFINKADASTLNFLVSYPWIYLLLF